MKVAVFAGTKKDTEMGVNILKNIGIEALSFPFSKNPKEQTAMQYYSKEELEDLFIEKVEEAKEMGGEKIFVYCNSLSSAVDCEKLSRLLNIKIVTPLEAYKNLPIGTKKVLILAANALSAYRVDKIIRESSEIETISMGMLELVEAIEKGLAPEKIIKDLKLKDLLSYGESIKVDSLILACTHFPYIREELESFSKLKIIDPKDYMIKSL